jgi:hypothetical protein
VAGTCTVADCSPPVDVRGLCGTHYKRVLRHADPRPTSPRGTRRPCCVGGCTNEAEGRGLCHGHLQRLLRTGDVAPDVPLSRRRQAEVCRGAHLCQEAVRQELVPGALPPACQRRRTSCRGAHQLAGGRVGSVTATATWCCPWSSGISRTAQRRRPSTACGWRCIWAGPFFPRKPCTIATAIAATTGSATWTWWSTAHPKGQRVADKLAFAVRLLLEYAPQLLAVDAVSDKRRGGHPEG